MAKSPYNTFVVVNCKSRKIVLVTSSARKAEALRVVGFRIDVWNCNRLVERIHAREKEPRPMEPYIQAERDFIGQRQLNREKRNNRRRDCNGKRAESAPR